MNRLVAGRSIARSIGFLLIIVGLGFGSTQFNSNSYHVSEGLMENSSEVAQTPQISTATSSSVIEVASNIISVRKAEAQTLVLPKGIHPNKLIIPKLNVSAPVRAMGLDGAKMAVPNNFTDIGWYKLGAKPGEQGSAVMGAHVDNGGNVKGVFKNLKNLKVGDDIYVTDANNNALHFKITARKIYPYRTKITDEVFQRNDKVRLNLITCHGTFLPKENTYTQRLVVFAELVEKQ
jgi:LPXTG-site transpeptidase (sortase) family protein